MERVGLSMDTRGEDTAMGGGEWEGGIDVQISPISRETQK